MVVLILRYVEGDRFSALHLSGILLTGSANEVMYFVPLLTQFYLLSPFIIFWAKKNWVSLIVIALILQVLVQLSAYSLVNVVALPIGDGINVFIPKWFFLSRIFWFPLGVVIGLQRKIYMQFILRYKWIWLVGAILFYLAAFMEWELLYRNSGEQWLAHIETNIDNLYSIAVLFLLLALNSSLGRWYSWISEVGTKSYGIYLTHAIFIMYTARIIYHSAPGLLAYQLVLQPILIAVGLGVPLALMAITDRTLLRRWYSYLYG